MGILCSYFMDRAGNREGRDLRKGVTGLRTVSPVGCTNQKLKIYNLSLFMYLRTPGFIVLAQSLSLSQMRDVFKDL